MRETPDGKVYGIDPQDPYESGERLYYDFGLQPGDTFKFDEWYEIKCIGVSTVQTSEGPRKCLKFDGYVYDQLIEGIDPVGDCDMSMPIRDYTACLPSCALAYTFLYERKTAAQNNGWMYQNEIVYKSADFDTFGIHDPSVWYWTKYTDVDDEVSVSQSVIKFDMVNGIPVITSTDEPILSVRGYDINGNLLKSVAPKANKYAIPGDLSNGVLLIVEVKTANHSAAKKLIF